MDSRFRGNDEKASPVTSTRRPPSSRPAAQPSSRHLELTLSASYV
jgi:hypothetical protein